LHKPSYIGRYDILEGMNNNGIFLINSPWKPEKVFENLTKDMQETIISKNIKVYVVDASDIAYKVGLRNKINTVMQTAFFKVTNIIPVDEAIELMKKHVEAQFKSKGKEIITMNFECIDETLNQVHEVPIVKTNKFMQTMLKLFLMMLLILRKE
jgi:pyruvate-ferredoxin/flavodoxin oxidoreductase